MVGHDEFDPHFARDFGFEETGDSAIDTDDHIHADTGKLTESLAVESIPFGKANRYVELDIRPKFPEHPEENGRPRHAIHIVIAVDADPPPVGHGAYDPFRGFGDAR
jgi:hypothetical protein